MTIAISEQNNKIGALPIKQAMFNNPQERGNNMGKSGVSSSRRGFLITVGSGGVAAAAAVASAVTRETKADNKTSSAPARRGYQLSEHIKKYYRTARA